jgi:hypothetical protein
VHEVLTGLLIAGAVTGAMGLLAVLWVRHRLRRALRITPGVRSAAPTAWLVSPASAARLHRRLRTVGRSAGLASTLDPGLVPVASELAGEAVALEPQVVAVAGLRRAGAGVRRDLSVRVAELEVVARRLTALSTEPSARSSADGPSRLLDRLAALESARRELVEIDRRAGLLRHP